MQIQVIASYAERCVTLQHADKTAWS